MVKGLILQINTFYLNMETQCREGTRQSVGLTAAPQGMDMVPLPAPGKWRNTGCPGAGAHSPGRVPVAVHDF